VVGLARTPVISILPLVLLFSACVKSQATQCGDLLCPVDAICTRSGTCVSGSLATACSGRAEGATCTLSELGDGTCQGGLCIIGSCGDGVVNGVEACDGRDLGGKTCVDFGSTDAAGLACAADCTFDKSRCNGICGDGHKGTEEECDGNDFGAKTCADFSPPGTTHKFYRGGVPTCTDQCKVNIATCTGGWCGDGVKQFAEGCDGNDLGTAPNGHPGPPTCMDFGHGGPTTALVCDPMTCTFTEDSCSCGINGVCAGLTPNCVNTGGTLSCAK
jgi:hypothetical protein